MTEPVSSTTAAVALTAGGITVLGMATGLHPALMLAGAWGGWWAMTYQPPMSARARLSRVLISAFAAGWLSPAALAIASQRELLPDAIAPSMLLYPVAMITGLLAVDVIGRWVMRLARQKAGEIAE